MKSTESSIFPILGDYNGILKECYKYGVNKLQNTFRMQDIADLTSYDLIFQLLFCSHMNY